LDPENQNLAQSINGPPLTGAPNGVGKNAAPVHHSTIREIKNANAVARRPQIGYRSLVTKVIYTPSNHHKILFPSPRNPARGGLFIETPTHIMIFLFFGGAVCVLTNKKNINAPPKNKKGNQKSSNL
jgi:hypothetical protein